MAPTASTFAVGDVVDDVVVAGGADAAGDVVEVQSVAEFPGDVVVGARTVTADADGAHEFAGFVV